MEGSHQKGSNWYRCQYVTRRGSAAADAAGHPRVLGIKEDKVLDAVLDFLAERIFGPSRLRLLRAELATAETDSWSEHDAELERLQRERSDVDRSLQRQVLRLEEHDDSNHPVVALATRRIEELSARAASIVEAITALQTKRPNGSSPDEIAAMLDAIPDMRDALATADETELAEIFDAFDVKATYDKLNARLELAATVTPELVTDQEKSDRPEGRSLNSVIAGAGFEPATFGL